MLPDVLGGHWISPDVLHSRLFLVLLTFVAINTIAYATLSLMKIVPLVRWQRRNVFDRRSEDRSIYGR